MILTFSLSPLPQLYNKLARRRRKILLSGWVASLILKTPALRNWSATTRRNGRKVSRKCVKAWTSLLMSSTEKRCQYWPRFSRIQSIAGRNRYPKWMTRKPALAILHSELGHSSPCQAQAQKSKTGIHPTRLNLWAPSCSRWSLSLFGVSLWTLWMAAPSFSKESVAC
jgi:hypothetical protein